MLTMTKCRNRFLAATTYVVLCMLVLSTVVEAVGIVGDLLK